MRAFFCLSLLLAGLATSCGGASSGTSIQGQEAPAPTTPVVSAVPAGQVRLYEDFERDLGDWSVGWSDYPSTDEERYELRFQRLPLPSETGSSSQALFVSGKDRDDGLFTFLKKEIVGLVPEREYEVRIRLSLFSKFPELKDESIAGVNTSLHLKIGALAFEPQRILSSSEDWLMNLDKGSSFQGGTDMLNLGELLVPGEQFPFAAIDRGNDASPIKVRANPQGSLWLIVGTDSSAGLQSEVYYDSIEAEIAPTDAD